MYTDKDMTTFAVLYSIGNVVAIASYEIPLSKFILTEPRSLLGRDLSVRR